MIGLNFVKKNLSDINDFTLSYLQGCR